MNEETIIKLKKENKSIFEKFGMFYLNVFQKLSDKQPNKKVVLTNDQEIKKKTNLVYYKSIVLTILVSICTVIPCVIVDLHFQNNSKFTYWFWFVLVTFVCIIIELYFLFLIAIKLVHDLQIIIKLDNYSSDLIALPTFHVKNILVRTALEIPDTELEILGIDPFKIISRRNLMVISLIYKVKIFLTNQIIKYLLIF